MISAVDGIAFGGGFSLAVTADIVMATRARFSLVFGRIGLIPDMTAACVLPRLIGPQRTKELTFTARSFGVEEAMSMGIVQEVHEAEALPPAAKRMASQLSQGSATAMAEAKRLIDMLAKQPSGNDRRGMRGSVGCRGTEFHGEPSGGS